MTDGDLICIEAGTFRCSLVLCGLETFELPKYRKLLRLLFTGAETREQEEVNDRAIRTLTEWFPDRLVRAKAAAKEAKRRYQLEFRPKPWGWQSQEAYLARIHHNTVLREARDAAQRTCAAIQKRHDIFYQEVKNHARNHD